VNTNSKRSSKASRRKSRRPKGIQSTVALIDKLLAEPVPVAVSGEGKRVPAIEAILLMLMRAEMAGNARASRVLLRYRAFAAQHGKKTLDVVFEDSDYTRALSRQPEETDVNG
jgi:hypothetical protein